MAYLVCFNSFNRAIGFGRGCRNCAIACYGLHAPMKEPVPDQLHGVNPLRSLPGYDELAGCLSTATLLAILKRRVAEDAETKTPTDSLLFFAISVPLRFKKDFVRSRTWVNFLVATSKEPIHLWHLESGVNNASKDATPPVQHTVNCIKEA